MRPSSGRWRLLRHIVTRRKCEKLCLQEKSEGLKHLEVFPMHTVVIAGVFLAMVLSPCLVAMRSGGGKDLD